MATLAYSIPSVGDPDGVYERRAEDGSPAAYLAFDGAGQLVAYRVVLPGENPDTVGAAVIKERDRVAQRIAESRRAQLRIVR